MRYISHLVCLIIMEIINYRPLLTKTLRNPIQNQYPFVVHITATLVFGLQCQKEVRALRLRYGKDKSSHPNHEIRRVFQEESLEFVTGEMGLQSCAHRDRSQCHDG